MTKGKGQDLIQYIIQCIVSYMDIPVEVRRENKMRQKNRVKETWPTKWFGIIPLSVNIWFGKWITQIKLLRLRRSNLKIKTTDSTSNSNSTS